MGSGDLTALSQRRSSSQRWEPRSSTVAVICVDPIEWGREMKWYFHRPDLLWCVSKVPVQFLRRRNASFGNCLGTNITAACSRYTAALHPDLWSKDSKHHAGKFLFRFLCDIMKKSYIWFKHFTIKQWRVGSWHAWIRVCFNSLLQFHSARMSTACTAYQEFESN